MKFFLFLIGMVAAGILGYSYEPQLRYQLTGKVPETKIVVAKRITIDTGKISPGNVEITVEPSPVPEAVDPAPVEPSDVPAAPIAAVEPFPEPEMPEETAEVVPPFEQPEPEPEPLMPAPAAGSGSPVDVVAVMQESIKSAAIKEFTFDQVLDWQASEEPETIDGASYRTGIASYKAETVFGVKTIQAKALVKDGKVVRWLWPKSGMEIN